MRLVLLLLVVLVGRLGADAAAGGGRLLESRRVEKVLSGAGAVTSRVVVETASDEERAVSAPAGAVQQPSAVDPVFSDNEPYAVYTSAGISLQTAIGSATLSDVRLSAASWLNPPYTSTVYNLSGDVMSFYLVNGAPQQDIALKVVTARHMDAAPASDVTSVVGVTVFNLTNNARWCELHAITSSGANPWSLVLPQCYTDLVDAVYKPLALSDDGSTVAFLVLSNCTAGGPANCTDTPTVQLYAVDAGSGEVLWVYALPAGSPVAMTAVTMTSDGQFIAFSNDQSVYVLNRADGTLRAPVINMGVAVPATMCPVGNFIVYGYETAFILRWNGSDYLPHFNVSGDNTWIVESHAVAVNGGGREVDGCLLTLGWTTYDVKQVKVSIHALVTGVNFWNYTSPVNTQVQNIPNMISMHLNYIAVACWGNNDPAAPSPQILLFFDKSPVPLISYVTPGSMFGVDVVALRSVQNNVTTDHVSVIAAGKHVHANVMGNGGDTFAFEIVNSF